LRSCSGEADMRAADRWLVLIATSLLGLPGCAHNPVPRELHVTAADAQRAVRGGWVMVEANQTSGGNRRALIVEGELIAVDESTIHVLTSTGLQSVRLEPRLLIRVVRFRSSSSSLAWWAVAGGLSTLSHGGFLILTAPMWAVGGVIAATAESRAAIAHDVAGARSFARFPQGLPPGLDPRALGTLPVAPRRE
jgi:hypothetical protein